MRGAALEVTRDDILPLLLHSREPSVRLKARLHVLGEDPDSRSIHELRGQVRNSPRARTLLRERMRPGRHSPRGVYHKWLGIHWALASLADLGYPEGDQTLQPAVDRALALWLRASYFREFDARTQEGAYARHDAVPRLRGRYRRCASQQGNALLYCTKLGLARESCDQLAERLLHWQWPDGGWNCDRNPSADTSAFAESLTPMSGLFEYGKARHDSDALMAARRASEVFLRRRLYKRESDGKVMHWEFPLLHYPLYWHYDVLGGLKALARMGLVTDPRCRDALDLIESKELPRGGWTAERRLYDLPGERARRGTDRVLWESGRTRVNEWVTVDALSVLRAAGRYSP